MSFSHSSFDPFSRHYTASDLSGRLTAIRRNAFTSRSASTAYRRSSQWTDAVMQRLDRVDTLGGEDDQGDVIGHSGCVNALAWSQDGMHLASGSDDTHVVLWKMGGAAESIETATSPPFPSLDLAQSDVIQTGHRANIFSVKWAPNSGDRRMFTCAADSQMRIFDLTRTSACTDVQSRSGARQWRHWGAYQGACTNVLRCHSDRVKVISTENSPDVFLSISEDGEVRQTDLRVPHVCSRDTSFGQGCPRPLVKFLMELYSLSVSKLEPWLFAVAGTSEKVYLMDRRMVPRLLKDEWGSHVDAESAALTHCVRKFARDQPDESVSSASARKLYGRAHVTAVKISESNGRDLIASYSDDGVFRFDLKAQPETIQMTNERQQPASASPRSERMQARRRSPSPASEEGESLGQASPPNETTALRTKIAFYLFPRVGTRRSYSGSLRRAILHDLFMVESNIEMGVRPNEPGNLSSAAKSMEIFVLCVSLMHLLKLNFLQVDQYEIAGHDALAMLSRLHHKDTVGALVPIFVAMRDACRAKEKERISLLYKQLFRQSYELIRTTWSDLALPDPNRAEDSVQLELDAELYEEAADVAEDLEIHKFDDTFPRSGPASWFGIPPQIGVHESDAWNSDRIWPGLEEMERRGLLTNAQVDVDEESEVEDGDADEDADDEDMHFSVVDEEDDEIDEEDDDDDDDDDMYYDDGDEEDDEIDEEDEEDDDDDDDDDMYYDEGDEEDMDGIERAVRYVSGRDAAIVRSASSFTGHANSETVKDCGFIGPNDEYVWSGSDCGHFFVWRNDRSGELVGVWKADDSVVNVLAPHPSLPVCAVSGIDDTIKIFAPLSDAKASTDGSANRTYMRDTIIERNRSQHAPLSMLRPSAQQVAARMLTRHFTLADGSVIDARLHDANEQDCEVM